MQRSDQLYTAMNKTLYCSYDFLVTVPTAEHVISHIFTPDDLDP